MNLTIYQFLQEINTHYGISDSNLEKAKQSSITVGNNSKLKRYTKDWVDGKYDEDPDMLAEAVISLL